MSADLPEIPDEFATSADLDALLNAEPPARKQTAKKAAPGGRVAPTPDQADMVRAQVNPGEYVVSASGISPAEPLAEQPSMDDFRALLAEVKALREQVAQPSTQITNYAAPSEQRRADVMDNPLPAPVQHRDPYNEPVGPQNRDLPSGPAAPISEQDGVLIHFVEDGFTVGGRVYYRGEQYVAPRNADWAGLSGTDQVMRFGKVMFRPGPWDGAGYDLSDPRLTSTDRQRLLEVMRRQQELAAQFTDTTAA